MTQDIIAGVLQREGWPKYTNLAADKGGSTKGGITQAAWSEWIERPATIADVMAITEPEAREFYEFKYVVQPHFDQVKDEHLRELLIDAGVNHGTRHPAKWAQWAAEVKQDGMLGPISLAAINACAPLELFLWVCAFRTRLYGRLTTLDPQMKKVRAAGIHLQAEFTAGWCNRVAQFLEDAARRIEKDHNRGV